MSKNIKKLVAVERVLVKPTLVKYPVGYKKLVLVDPETGKLYEPNPGWEVIGDALEELFREYEG